MKVSLWHPNTRPDGYGVRYRDPKTKKVVRRGCVPAYPALPLDDPRQQWRKGTIDQAQAEIARLSQDERGNQTVRYAVQQWLRYKRALNLRDASLANYETGLKGFSAYVPVTHLYSLTRAHVEGYLIYMTEDQHLGASSQHSRLVILKDFLTWCALPGREWVRNPDQLLAGIKAPRVDVVEAEPFTPQQWQSLLQAADPDLRYNLQMLYHTGLRVESGWCALTWECVNLPVRTYRVVMTKSRKEKTKRLNATAYALLYAHRDRPQPATMPAVLIRAGMRLIGAQQGIPKRLLHPHTIRHTAVSYLIDQGADIKDVQDFCDHASVTTTLKVYGHRFRDKSQATVDLLDTHEMNYQPLTLHVK